MASKNVKYALGVVGIVYVFVIIPAGVVTFVALGKLEEGLAGKVFSFISGLISSPAGQFLWDK